jgi:hypothetical protein
MQKEWHAATKPLKKRISEAAIGGAGDIILIKKNKNKNS